MKKVVGITTGIVVIAVAGWLGTTYYTGKRIESEEPAKLAKLNQELAKALATTGFGAEIKQLSYDRHFFSSDVRYGIHLTSVPGQDTPPKEMVEVAAHIEHGPFTKGAIAKGQWAPKLAFIHTEVASNDLLKPLFELTKGISPLTADTILSYNGDGAGTASVPPIEYTEGKQSLKFSGMQLDGSFERATQRTVGTAKTDTVALSIADDGDGSTVQANISGLLMDVDSRMGQFDLGIGSSSAKIDNISIQIEEPASVEPDEDDAQEADPSATPADPSAAPSAPSAPPPAAAAPTVKRQIGLKDLGYTANIGESGSNLNVEATYKVGQITVDNSDYGKGHATIKLDKIDGKATKALSESYNELLSDVTHAKGNDTGSNARVIEIANQALQLLASNPTLRVDPLVWETPQGQSNLNLAIELTKPEGLNAAKGLTGDFKQLAQQAVKLIDLKVSVSKPMVQGLATQYLQREGMDAAAAKKEAEEQVTSMAGMAEMFGIAKTNGDNVVGTFHYADQKATLNGEEIPADALFDSLLGGVGDSDEEDDGDNTMLHSLDPAKIGEMLDDSNFSYELATTQAATPVLTIDGTGEGARSVEIFFNDCESDSSCADMQMRITVATAGPVPQRAINEWNQTNRPTRAYWDADSQVAVLEMDLDAYGGVGEQKVQYAVNTFLNMIVTFVDTMQEAAPRTSSKP